MRNEMPERAAALIERIGRLIGGEAHAEGLQPVQWEALRYLAKANRFSRTGAALTAYLGLTKGTVSQTLKALEAKGLVRKRVDTKDRRSNRLTLTAKGQRLLLKDPLCETVSAIDGLPTSTQSELMQGLEALLSTRLAAQSRQPFGQCRDCLYFSGHDPAGGPHYCELLKEKLAEGEALAICSEQRPRV